MRTERQDKLCGVTILVRVHCSCVAQAGLVHWAVKELQWPASWGWARAPCAS